jgi:hypothetical protein
VIRRLDARALLAAALAFALAACVIGPKPDDPLTGGDGTGSLDAGEDSREIADVGAVPNLDSASVPDAPTAGGGDAGADAADASEADAASDAADDASDATDATSDATDGAASDGAADLDADAANDGGPG